MSVPEGGMKVQQQLFQSSEPISLFHSGSSATVHCHSDLYITPPRPTTRRSRRIHNRAMARRKLCPGAPCTRDSSSLGARR